MGKKVRKNKFLAKITGKINSISIEILVSLILILFIQYNLFSSLNQPLQLLLYKVVIISLAIVHARIVRKLIVGDLDVSGQTLRNYVDTIIKNHMLPEEIKKAYIISETSIYALKLVFAILIYVSFIIGYSLAI